MTPRLLLPLLALPLLLACSAPTEDSAESSDSAIEVQDQDLWAGLASYTIERYTSDPCGGQRLDDAPISYDEWTRQRAGVRNVCFEVWKPGVTDRDNADYWRLIDAQVHYRYKGTSDWKMAYVPSIDRRGNNRRYAWNLGFDLDPVGGYNIADVKAPVTLGSETDKSVEVSAELEFYFTVNGHKLSSSTNQSFRVAYHGTVEKPGAPDVNGDQVLYPDVTCNGVTVGSGAGFFAADIKDPTAIAELGAGLDGSKIYSPRMGTSNAKKTLSVYFSSLVNTPAGELPNYVDGYYGPSWHAETRGAAADKLTVSVKAYDRATNKLETLTHTFDGCVKN